MHALYLHMYAFSSWKSWLEHRLGWCHVVPGWLSPRRIASRVTWKTETSLRLRHPPPCPLLLPRPPSFFVTHPFYRPFRLPFSSFLSFFILSYSVSHSSHHPLLSFPSSSISSSLFHDFVFRIGRFLPTLFWYFILVVHIIVLLSIPVVVGIELTFPNGRSLPRLNEHFDGRRAFPSAIVGYCREERMRWCSTNATNTGRFEKRVVEF